MPARRSNVKEEHPPPSFLGAADEPNDDAQQSSSDAEEEDSASQASSSQAPAKKEALATHASTLQTVPRSIPIATPSSSLVSKPRLVIKNIEVDNFKSYAGQHTIGPFHKTFTAVIGPNGSGKSNVIDAMLFVFGKNAKKIRLEKLSELIHTSTAYPNLTRASVTVNFVQVRETEEDKKDPCQRLEVPNSNLSIMREVFRTNVSQYYINGHKRTQREVVETLTGHGIDLDHNRFLILQGEVQQIALMKPKAEKEGEEGLVEYFDDLIGSNQFLPSIKEATRLVEEYQENRLTSLDALRKVQGERDALSSAKDSTLSFIRKDNHLQKMVTVLCQMKLAIMEETLAEPKRRVAEIDAVINSLEERKGLREGELMEQSNKKKEVVKQMDELRTEIQTLKKEKSKNEVEAEKLKTSNDEFEKQKKKENDRLKRFKDEAQKLEMEMHHNENGLKIAEQNHAEALANVARLQEEFDAKSNEVTAIQLPLRKQLEELRRELAPLDVAMAKAEQHVQDAKARLEAVVSEELAAGEEFAQLSEERQNKLVLMQKNEDRIHKAEEGSPELDAAITALEERRLKAVKLKYHLNSQIDIAKKEFSAAESGDHVSRTLASKSLPKYYGSLRQLGRIADEYDVAAGVASGMWDYHVVEDNDTAVQVVEILKKEGLRCTMMVLEKIEKIHGAEMNKEFRAPPGSQRLFDLIAPVKPKFRIAFYNAVRNTLVVNDIDTARKVAFDGSVRHRVATVRGELLERTGGFSGGGMTPPGARLKATHAAPDKEATRKKLQAWQADLIAAVAEVDSIAQQITTLSAQRSDVSPEELRRLRIETAGLKQSIQHLTQRLETNKERLREAQQAAKKRDILEDKLSTANDVKAKAEISRRTLANKVAALENELQDVAGPEFRKLSDDLKHNKRMVDKSETDARDFKKNAAKAKVTREAKLKEIEKCQANIEKIQSEAQEADKEQALKLAAAIEELNTKIRKTTQQLSEREGHQVELENHLTEITRKISQISKEIESKERDRAEEVSKMEADQAKIENVHKKIEECRKKVLEHVSVFGVCTLKTHDVENGIGRRGRKRERAIVPRTDEEGNPIDDEEGEYNPDHSQATTISTQPRDDEEDEDEIDDDDAFDAENYHLTVTADQLKNYEESRVRMVAQELQAECQRLRGTINFEAVNIWRGKQAEYKTRKEAYEKVLAAVNKAESDLDDLTERRKELFMDNFKVIQRKLKEMYQLLAQGGDADVDLVNSSDPYEGIAFTVRPPKKSWKQVGNLSGGEQTLSSLALVFALHHIKPTPIYVMDEIDAALDFRNVSIVGRYVLEQAQGAQFIIISLRNNMFELAHQLVGICKVNDVTRSLTINPSEVSKRIQKQLERIHAVQRGARNAQPLLVEQKRSRGPQAGAVSYDGRAPALDEEGNAEENNAAQQPKGGARHE